MANRPRSGEHHNPPPAGSSQASSAKTSSSSSSSKVYDKKDINKDGTMSWMEEQEYAAEHPEAANESTSTPSAVSEQGTLDTLA